MPLELETTIETRAEGPARRFEFKRKVSVKDRQFFTEQLALLLETGTPLHSALQMLEHQVDNPSMAAIIERMVEDIATGKTFSYACAIFVEELEDVPVGALVIFSAHGVSRQVHREAQARNLQVFDATCPLVTKVHLEVSKLAGQETETILKSTRR